MKKIVFFACLCTAPLTWGKEEEKYHYLREGNFALDTSQEPGSLFSFGQFVIDEGDLLGLAYYSNFRGIQSSKSASVIPGVIYGVTDSFSLFVNTPVVTRERYNNLRSSGMGDIFIQGEYSLYAKNSFTYQNQITVVGSVFFPTGSSKKNPATGFGSPSFFIGGTAVHLATDWYCFAAPGAWLTTSHHGTKFGNQFFYEWGLGKNMAYAPDKFILTWMVECIGIYTQRDKISGITDPNSGGNSFYIGPSLWFSTPRLIVQAGITFPATQHLFGIQNKGSYWAALNIGWKFN